MREIKFRITYQHRDTGRFTQRVIELGQPIPLIGERWSVVGKDQYTGLKDKNGREVYAGDIVACMDGILAVEYESSTSDSGALYSGFTFRHPSRGAWRGIGGVEVIGNLYENPELLEAKHD